MIISLIGYMGSGKSTTGKDLAKALGFEFIDLDDFIEQKYQTKISDIFKKEGELGFRKKEREALKEILTTTNIVLSLGGGTPVYYDNMEEIVKNSISIFMRVQLPQLVKRLENRKETRPLIAHLSNEEMTEFIAKHLFERNQYYEKAKYTISITTQSTLEILDEIMSQLKKGEDLELI
ncbi:shikimate kinase [Empedobacter falsenii]|uniref:Shikimate kinase n=1 Tax=Empedobacter falsenii TaxID=343874 RepID=A0ABY8V680_9FLAO|nr:MULTISPECIES: shikimate kinase [Empedobacter]MDM1523521.1 shikimate kinase [Empedobacter sp. 225-1]MDM1543480.1 shikimate kinase [Empedobacter sp. 189-2]WIH97086.1 shikimate kinase [Empedobacter falsenii]HJD86692.1 shikimate kinase [Empedobacter falsenii]